MINSIAILSPVYVTLIWSLVLFFHKKSTEKANKVLAVFMAVAFILYSCHVIFFNGFYHLYSFIDPIYLLTQLSLYPLFYAYILLLTGARIRITRYWLNFLPALIISILSFILNFFLTPEQRIIYVKEVLVNHNNDGIGFLSVIAVKSILSVLARVIFIIHAVVYLLLIIRTANKHNATIPNYYSNTEGRNLHWVRNLSIFMLLASGFGITLAILGRGFFTDHEFSLLIPSIAFSTIYFLIGFFSIQQVMITETIDETINNKDQDNFNNIYINRLKSKLLVLFEKDKIYIHPDLRITTIAEILGTNRTYVSRLINEEFGMNFNEFVNKYRILESEALLNCAEHDAFTLEYIAEKSGFGNVNSFSRSFKEFNGITPGQFRINCQKEMARVKR